MTNFGISSRSHNGLHLGPVMKCDSMKWLIWAQEWTNTDSRIWLKSCLGSRVGFDSTVGSKSKDWYSYSFSINGIWLFKIGGSISRSMGTWINVGAGIRSKSSKDTWVNIDSKFETESQSWRLVSHLHQVQSHWSENLPIFQWFLIGQNQSIVIKLNLCSTPWFLGQINEVRDIKIGQQL